MGNQCLPESPNQYYRQHLKDVNISELRNQWSTLQVYKIRKIFDKAASKKDQNQDNIGLEFSDFCQLFPQFIRYEEEQKRKIFMIFDRDNAGHIDWQNFYSSMSLCYFGSQSVISTLMFMIFDHNQSQKLEKQELTLLIDLNAIYIQQNQLETQIQPQEVLISLLDQDNSISLEDWLKKSSNYFDFNQFRRFFNIFKEEKMEKQLVQNFFQWNQLFNEDQEKYISYIVNYKWFECWKTYIELQYNISLCIEEKNPITMKSIKTKKSLKTNNSSKSYKKITQPNSVMKRLKFGFQNESSTLKEETIKNYDMIHSAIGERPYQIYNYFLEGEYEEILKPGLVENRDYVLVSQKVWKYLSEIYDGYPEFRRTGYDQIELYPKIVKIYNDLFKNQISYSTEVRREVSGSITIEDLMTKSIEIDKKQLQNYSLFYRTTELPVWVRINNLTQMFSQLTSQMIIFLIYLPTDSKSQKIFMQKYLTPSKSAQFPNLGDTLLFEDVFKRKQKQKQVIFMNKNVEGKYIIHFVGQPYNNDRCLSQKQFHKFCRLKENQQILFDHKPKKKQKKRIGIEQVKSISFITSTILHFLENPNFRNCLGKLSNNCDESEQKKLQTTSMSIVLGYIGQLIKANRKVDPKDLLYLVNTFLPSYADFDISLVKFFLDSFTKQLKEEAEMLQIDDVVQDYQFSMETTMRCGKCGTQTQEIQNDQCVLSVPIPENPNGYFQINYVPFNLGLTSLSVKKYGFQLSKGATLKQYKKKFQEVAELKDKLYILVEVYGHTIIKNYSQANEQTPISRIHLREDDSIFAYEICTNFDRFILDHYKFSQKGDTTVESKELKVGQMIDCKNGEKGWIIGKILEKDIVPYTYKERIKVMHKMSKSEHYERSYEFERDSIACFPSRSYQNCDQFYLRLVQRVFNEANNHMDLCNIPMVIVLTSWMRWKQFNYLVFLQIKKFITQHYKFNREDPSEDRYRMLGYGIQSSLLKQACRMKIKRFKEYLYGKNFPYTLKFIDYSGHCAICYKFVKSIIYKGQSQSYCEGCKLNPKQPICWQIRVTDLMIAVDWVCSEATKKNVIRSHNSYINMINSKKKDIQTIQSCIKSMMNEVEEDSEMLCCNVPTKVSKQRKFLNTPQYLIVHLKRIVEQKGFKKTIKRPVNFNQQIINIHGTQYQLVGLTALKGHQNHINYSTYIKGSQKWYAYNGERVQVARKQEIDRRCTLVFYYKKIKTFEGIKSHFFMNEYKNDEDQLQQLKNYEDQLQQFKNYEDQLQQFKNDEDQLQQLANFDDNLSRSSLMNVNLV